MKKRLKFNAQGKLVGVDGAWLNRTKIPEGADNGEPELAPSELKTSASLTFLRQRGNQEAEADSEAWSLHRDGVKLAPLKFSNGKTQSDVVDEVAQLIAQGKKVILIQGVCGTGKSAIALNIARRLGRASIVVPVKALQKQYEHDYMSRMYLVKTDRTRMSIAMITGRENHDSLIKPGVSCAHPTLPDTVLITERNASLVREYYAHNPLIEHKRELPLKALRRISIAPANPYWSPIISSVYHLPLRDATLKRYRGLHGQEFIFYHRKEGCSYYDQYQAYLDADVLIFNAAKFLIETALNRRPDTAVDIIDEADEFLDNFSEQEELNLTRLASYLQNLRLELSTASDARDALLEFLELEEKRARALGIAEDKLYHSSETKLPKILSLLLASPDLVAEIALDDNHYANTALDIAETFRELLDSTYITYRRKESELLATLVTTNLAQKFAELAGKSRALVLMSGTLHSQDVLRDVFGIREFVVVEAETQQPGTIDIHRTGKEMNCRYAHLSSGEHTRQQYLQALDACLARAKRPVLVHVHAFNDLPTEAEKSVYALQHLLSREQLLAAQAADKIGQQVTDFKEKKSDVLYSTRCARGIDFPGEMCNSIVFTKYPNPNPKGVFWQVLQKNHADYYWEFYHDKARRDFLQRLYRALRSQDDHVYILSPDTRVLESVKKMQNTQFKGINNE